MNFKNKIINHSYFDIGVLLLIAYYTIAIKPATIIFTYLVTKANNNNSENVLNAFIIEFSAFVLIAQIYFINTYNYVVKTKVFKKNYEKLSTIYPKLNQFNPEDLFNPDKIIDSMEDKMEFEKLKLHLNDSDNSDTGMNSDSELNSDSDINSDDKNNSDYVSAKEMPTESPSKKFKKAMMGELLKNPELISNMSKMVGAINPELLKNMSKSMNNF